ncbi:hypothetical protein [Saccharolobus islandicus]|uniref:Uncharacterized protein n=1 Tax=Saccharolobus islandicus (strain M.16.27) TaxID=427318 RepID=C3N1T3_SACI3|nr:hypothetical protein [Sulfolobus islandicus]ACP54343.1 hypothetical protein M1627_2877 [Sulfolobus islandicus M.16.27]
MKVQTLIYATYGKSPPIPTPNNNLEMKSSTKFWEIADNRGVADLFKGKLLKITLFVTSVWFLFDVAAYGMVCIIQLYLKNLHFHLNMRQYWGLRLSLELPF